MMVTILSVMAEMLWSDGRWVLPAGQRPSVELALSWPLRMTKVPSAEDPGSATSARGPATSLTYVRRWRLSREEKWRSVSRIRSVGEQYVVFAKLRIIVSTTISKPRWILPQEAV